MSTRAIIMAGGPGERWGNYLGVYKHYVKIEGEPLLYRTYSQLANQAIGDILIVDQPDMVETSLQVPSKRRGPAAIFELFDCRNPDDPGLWNHDGRTIMFFGDVWYSDAAMRTILAGKDEEFGFTWFARHRRAAGFSENVNKEIWAISFLPHAQPAIAEAMRKCLDLYDAGKLKRCGGWEVYHVVRGWDPNERRFGGGFVTIIDWTEDFDTPKDYRQWVQKRREWRESLSRE